MLTVNELQQHCGWIFHVFAEVLKPACTDGSVNSSVISADRYRDESAFLETETIDDDNKLVNPC